MRFQAIRPQPRKPPRVSIFNSNRWLSAGWKNRLKLAETQHHDGVLEALDNRKKEALLKIVREQIALGKTQYILTLIQADMPRDAKGKPISFGNDEVVLRLHDEGDDGRLFRMSEF